MPFNQSFFFFSIFSQDSKPRHLLLNITRTGGLVGDVAVNLSVSYILPGGSSSSNEEQQEVTLLAGSSSIPVTMQIANDQFIKLGAAFKAELMGVALRGGGGCMNLVPSMLESIKEANVVVQTHGKLPPANLQLSRLECIHREIWLVCT